MGKIRVKETGNQISVWIKLALGEDVYIQNLAVLVQGEGFGLLKPIKIGSGKICYEEFIGMTLREYLSSGISRHDLMRVLEQFLILVREMRERGLRMNSLVMELDTAFFAAEKNEIRMLHSENVHQNDGSIENFIYAILDAFHTEKTADLDFRRRLIDFLHKKGNTDVYRIEEFLARENKSLVRKIRDDHSGNERTAFLDDDGEGDEPTGFIGDDDPNDDEPTGFIDSKVAENEDATDYYAEENEDDEPTGFIEEDETNYYEGNDPGASFRNIGCNDRENGEGKYPELLRKNTGEKVTIRKSVFRIGRETGKVDYCIVNNRNISRAHIDIIRRNGNCYIMDLNSKNRTFVNERAIPSNIEIELKNGDVMKLCDEEFVFLYE